jgi:hypothetical protein
MNFLQEHINYIDNLSKSLSKIQQLEIAKQRLTFTRWKATENLDKLLFEFETNVKKTDGKVDWCPDKSIAVDLLNKHLKNTEKANFLNHVGVNYFLKEIEFNDFSNDRNADTLVIDAKFIIANTGNIYTSFYTFDEYQLFLKAKKIIVIAGVDTLLSYQSELPLSKMLYSVFETGKLNYPAEILMRPGYSIGLKKEINVLICDLNKSNILENPTHRPLFNLLNFKLPPICPLEQFDYHSNNWKYVDSLQYFLYPFYHDIKSYKNLFFENNGLRHLSEYIPYDIDIYEQVLSARNEIHLMSKKPVFNLFDGHKLNHLPLKPKNFNNKNKFDKYAKTFFFGE